MKITKRCQHCGDVLLQSEGELAIERCAAQIHVAAERERVKKLAVEIVRDACQGKLPWENIIREIEAIK